MPEVRFRIRWPDGAEEECYSPSTAVSAFFAAGEDYALTDFLARARAALHAASARVEARYGFACSSAMAQLARIDAEAARFASDPKARVACLALR